MAHLYLSLQRLLPFFALALIFSCSRQAEPQTCTPVPDAADRYQYPAPAGSSAWNNIASMDERFTVSQLPDNLLPVISTEGLVQSCVENPVSAYQFAFNLPLDGRGMLFSRVNCFQELLAREDAAVKLLDRYRQTSPVCVDGIGDDAGKIEFLQMIRHMELVIAKDEIIVQLSPAQRGDLAREIIKKDVAKTAYTKTDYTNIVTGVRNSGIFLLARVMKAAAYDPFLRAERGNESMRLFVETAVPGNIELNEVLALGRQFAR